MKVRSQILSPSVTGIAILCAAVFVANAHTAQAGINVWTTHGPATGSVPVIALVIDPTTPGTLYASTEDVEGTRSAPPGVFKSTDGGDTWSAASTGLPFPRRVTALGIDPTMPGTLYAVNGGGFKSTDAGGSWSAMNTLPTNSRVTALGIDPSTRGTLYAGIFQAGVFKSTDRGNTWSAASTGLPEGFTVDALVIDPTTPGTLYAGADGGGFKSTDAGGSWSAMNTLPTNLAVAALAIDPNTPSTLYAGTPSTFDPRTGTSRGRVFKSTDGGNSWSAANTGLPEGFIVTDLAIDPTTPGTLYAGTAVRTAVNGVDFVPGVFKSTDGASTWNAVNAGLYFYVNALVIDPTTPGTLYAGSNVGGVFKSTNAAGSWSAANAGLPETGYQNVIALALDPTTPGTLYAGTFKSTNAGGTWSAASTGLPEGFAVDALVIDPTTPSTLYAGTDGGTVTAGGGVFKSTDAGNTWSAANAGLNFFVNALVIDPSTPETLYAGTGLRGVFKSTDGARTWSAVNVGLTDAYVDALAIDPTTPTTLYAGAEGRHGGVFKSTDAGGSWSAVNAGLMYPYVDALALDPTTPDTLYAGTVRVELVGAGFVGGGVFKSTNAGATWSAASTGLDNTPSVAALVIDPTTPGTLYAATEGVFKSIDAGATWGAFNTGLTSGPTALVIDPRMPGTLYAGTGGGVFDIEQVLPSCIGDCGGTSTVAINDIITLVNIDLGNAEASCAHGVASGADVNVAVIIQAVNNALNGCP